MIQVLNRDGLVERFKERQVGSEVYYPLAMHRQDCFRHLGYSEGDNPAAERAARKVVAIPIYPELTPEALEYVADAVIAFVDKSG